MTPPLGRRVERGTHLTGLVFGFRGLPCGPMPHEVCVATHEGNPEDAFFPPQNRGDERREPNERG